MFHRISLAQLGFFIQNVFDRSASTGFDRVGSYSIERRVAKFAVYLVFFCTEFFLLVLFYFLFCVSCFFFFTASWGHRGMSSSSVLCCATTSCVRVEVLFFFSILFLMDSAFLFLPILFRVFFCAVKGAGMAGGGGGWGEPGAANEEGLGPAHPPPRRALIGRAPISPLSPQSADAVSMSTPRDAYRRSPSNNNPRPKAILQISHKTLFDT